MRFLSSYLKAAQRLAAVAAVALAAIVSQPAADAADWLGRVDCDAPISKLSISEIAQCAQAIKEPLAPPPGNPAAVGYTILFDDEEARKSCPSLTEAKRLDDLTIWLKCTNGESFRIFKNAALSCSKLEAQGITGCDGTLRSKADIEKTKTSIPAPPPPPSEQRKFQDRGASSFCPKPYVMTERDGCQPARLR